MREFDPSECYAYIASYYKGYQSLLLWLESNVPSYFFSLQKQGQADWIQHKFWQGIFFVFIIASLLISLKQAALQFVTLFLETFSFHCPTLKPSLLGLPLKPLQPAIVKIFCLSQSNCCKNLLFAFSNFDPKSINYRKT